MDRDLLSLRREVANHLSIRPMSKDRGTATRGTCCERVVGSSEDNMALFAFFDLDDIPAGKVEEIHAQYQLLNVIYRLKITVFQITCHAAKRLQRIGSLT